MSQYFIISFAEIIVQLFISNISIWFLLFTKIFQFLISTSISISINYSYLSYLCYLLIQLLSYYTYFY